MILEIYDDAFGGAREARWKNLYGMESSLESDLTEVFASHPQPIRQVNRSVLCH